MKKLLYILFLMTVLFSCKQIEPEPPYIVPVPDQMLFSSKGVCSSLFSISPTQTVCFSHGNLQFKASTNVWRFADEQYNIIGSSNSQMSYNYSGWIDLFAYGASGYNGRMPYTTDYLPNYDICGTSYDWGVYCKIINGGNIPGLWRTLKYEEWNYLLHRKLDKYDRNFIGKVDDIDGLFLLPDYWDLSTLDYVSLLFSHDASSTSNNSYNYSSYYNNSKPPLPMYSFTVDQWHMLEKLGVVFLPMIGSREGSKYKESDAAYWCSDESFSTIAGILEMSRLSSYDWNGITKFGHYVRLVMNSEDYSSYIQRDNDPASDTLLIEPYILNSGTFSVSSVKKVRFAFGNLQYNSFRKEWRFANNQLDVVGSYAYQGSSYNVSDRWDDLFVYGATGKLSSSYYGGTYAYEDRKSIAYTENDWGCRYAISNAGNVPDIWRTLSMNEWTYLLSGRPRAEELSEFIYVGDLKGYLLLPDNWNGSTFYYGDKISIQEWESLDSKGAIFLPFAGGRYATNTYEVNEQGIYWCSTVNSEGYPGIVGLYGLRVGYNPFSNGCFSVRLVQDKK